MEYCDLDIYVKKMLMDIFLQHLFQWILNTFIVALYLYHRIAYIITFPYYSLYITYVMVNLKQDDHSKP